MKKPMPEMNMIFQCCRLRLASSMRSRMFVPAGVASVMVIVRPCRFAAPNRRVGVTVPSSTGFRRRAPSKAFAFAQSLGPSFFKSSPFSVDFRMAFQAALTSGGEHLLSSARNVKTRS